MSAIAQGHTIEKDEMRAISEMARELRAGEAQFAILFISSQFDRARIEQALEKHFPCPVYGCTTAGEIGAAGYSQHGIAGVAFHAKKTFCEPVLIEGVSQASTEILEQAGIKVQDQTQRLSARKGIANTFGLLITDGLSLSEEKVINALEVHAPKLPIVGGSAGDDCSFRETFVLFDGKFISNAALVLVCATALSVFMFKGQHFVPSEKKFQISKSDPQKRIVYEIDKKPAAREYARLLGLSLKDLTPAAYSKSPLMITVEGEHFVRAVRCVNEDGTLSFYAGIPEGTTMRVARGIDFLESLRDSLALINECLVAPEAVLCFECILRRLEVVSCNLEDRVGALYARARAVGFHTYGEQYASNHINQSLAGIAFGEPRN